MVYDLGIVIPVYRSKASVQALIEEIRRTFPEELRFQICLVDDSGDGGRTADYLKRHCLGPEVTLVVQERNGGQQKALLCGLNTLQKRKPCRFYGTIDDDMQQPAVALLQIYEKAAEGFDVVYGIPEERHPGLLRRWGSSLRDATFFLLLGVPRGMRVSSLRVMTDQLVRRVTEQAQGPFFYLSAEIFSGNKGLVRTANLFYESRRRTEGQSGYSIKKLVCLYGKIFWYYVLKAGRGEELHEKR